MKFTIFGSKGFIGSHLVKALSAQGHDCYCPERTDVKFDKNLGHVIYCVGLTADFRSKPRETIEAHVGKLNSLFETLKFDSFLYLSSTRVYKNSIKTDEDEKILIDVHNPDELYNISKLCGESICLATNNPQVRVVRLSNVIGGDFKSENFVSSIIKEMKEKESLTLFSSLNSEKDYVAISDVVRLIEKVTVSGKSRLYNIANGRNISTEEIIKWYEKKTNKKIKVSVQKENLIQLNRISNTKIKHEFGFEEKSIDFIFSEVLCNGNNY